ncbi:MAG: prephenate dehydratase domain-containing protein [Candidatus Moranbacteria bacterium]|nr:prephenate dehydratase domain-containing protein [Candidatus Moranbacteria bacterium]
MDKIDNTSEGTVIGVSGQVGSFSEEAAKYYCQKNGIDGFRIEYLTSVEGVLSNLEAGKIDQGVFPIENSNGGIVIEAVYAMAGHNFQIEKMFEIDIKHCLLGQKGANASGIKKITSHQQALRQCRMYLKRKWADVELEEYSDTASAAKDLSEGKFPVSTAVIASKGCAQIYGLDILEEGIQDLKFNFTTFIVASRK